MNKILLVEDDQVLGQGIIYALEDEGSIVSRAFDIEGGKKYFESEEFDLILLDVMLPDGNGYDFCKYIRRNKKSDIPIIFLTACDDEVNVVLGLDMGGDDYITKPFRVRELISRINAVMRRNKRDRKEDSTNILKSKNIEIDSIKGRVTRDGSEIILTPIEYKLLTLFIENKGQLLTRNLIFERVWDVEGDFVDDNTLSVYIKRLREKIEDNPQKPEKIKTVRGMGYRWDENGVD